MNNFGKLRRCTDRDGAIIDFYLAAAFVHVRCLIRKARQTCGRAVLPPAASSNTGTAKSIAACLCW